MKEIQHIVKTSDIFWSFWQQCSACRIGTGYVLLINDRMDGCLEYLNVTVSCRKTINNKVMDRDMHVKSYPYPIKDYIGTEKKILLADACNQFMADYPELMEE